MNFTLFGYEFTIEREPFDYFGWLVRRRNNRMWTGVKGFVALNQPTLKLLRLAIHAENQRQREADIIKRSANIVKFLKPDGYKIDHYKKYVHHCRPDESCGANPPEPPANEKVTKP